MPHPQQQEVATRGLILPTNRLVLPTSSHGCGIAPSKKGIKLTLNSLAPRNADLGKIML